MLEHEFGGEDGGEEDLGITVGGLDDGDGDDDEWEDEVEEHGHGNA